MGVLVAVGLVVSDTFWKRARGEKVEKENDEEEEQELFDKKKCTK